MSSQPFIESRKTIFFVYRQEDSQSARQIYDRLICNWVFWDSALIDVVSAFPGADLRLLFEQQPRFILLAIVGPELEGNECQEGESDFVRIGIEYALERKEDVRVGAIFLQNAFPRSCSRVQELAYDFAIMRGKRSLSVNDLDEDDKQQLDSFVPRILMGGWEAPRMMFSGAGPPDPNDCRLRVEAEISEEYARAVARRHTELEEEPALPPLPPAEEIGPAPGAAPVAPASVAPVPAVPAAAPEHAAAPAIVSMRPPPAPDAKQTIKISLPGKGEGGPVSEVPAAPITAPDPADPYATITIPPEITVKPPQTNQVNFSAMAQGQLEAGARFILDIWAHTESQTEQVKVLANEMGRPSPKGTKQGVKILQGSMLEVHMSLPGFEVADPVDFLTWNGDPVNASFPVTAPKDCTEGSHLGTASIHSHGLIICKLHFQIEIGAGVSAASEDLTMKTERPRTAFASYSRQDLNDVLGRVQGLEKGNPRLAVTMDRDALRSGQNYRKRLEELIPTRDVFYLFWSKSASESEEVDWEWRLARDRRGIDYIDPVPLVDPEEVPPPAELASLHFNDKWLAFMKSSEH